MNLSRILLLIIVVCFVSCNNEPWSYTIAVSNPSKVDRNSETIQILINELRGISSEDVERLSVIDNAGKPILTQLVDEDLDKKFDYLIFQVTLKANDSQKFLLLKNTDEFQLLKSPISTFCGFVPERMDDFAWENDKVAFRTYGPECQRLFEKGNPAGLISSGIDCWLKRVDYPIIDKWYAEDKQGKSYHVDNGEGLDNYHVGSTRGCGGTAVLVNGEYALSENFKNWRIITNGPIRSIFELEYQAYLTDTLNVYENKRITIDLGSNLYKCEVQYNCEQPIEHVAIGIAHHDKNGKIGFNKDLGCLSYWEPQDDSYLGTAVIVDSSTSSECVMTKDDDNIWLNLDIVDKSFTYWSGFGWKKAGGYSSFTEWNELILRKSKEQNIPLDINMNKTRM